MGKPAARIGDMHVCPMITVLVPHVGGPVIGPGVPTVLIGGMPAAVMGDMCVCTGPPDTIMLGSAGVMIGGKPAARMGDLCAHGGAIILGCMTVLIGEVSPGPVSVSVPGLLSAEGLASLPGIASVIPKVPSPPPLPDIMVPQVQAAIKMTAAFATKASRIQALLQGAEEGAMHVHKHNDNQCKVHYQVFSKTEEPVKGQKYEIRTSDGQVFKGTTDSNGKTQEISGYTEGMCEISFLD
jgi:uncharacterized Zn-binding protein involved in type VI secretion